MLRSFTAIFLLFALTSSQFSQLFIYAGFELNRDYIASTLCENRDKPELHCDGKCFLMKKLKQAEEKEKKQAQEAQKKNFQDHYLVKPIISLALPTYIVKKRPVVEIFFELPTNSFKILHPPQNRFS
jgi:hypothetical protein